MKKNWPQPSSTYPPTLHENTRTCARDSGPPRMLSGPKYDNHIFNRKQFPQFGPPEMLSGVQQKCYLVLTFLGRQEWFMGVPIARGDGDGEDAEHDREDEGRGHV